MVLFFSLFDLFVVCFVQTAFDIFVLSDFGIYCFCLVCLWCFYLFFGVFCVCASVVFNVFVSTCLPTTANTFDHAPSTDPLAAGQELPLSKNSEY